MIKIVTACNDSKPYGELADICKFTIKRYCKRHRIGYSFYRITENERPAAWYKIPLLLKEFERKSTRYCLWMDADSLIYNPRFKIRSMLRPGKQLYLSKDFNAINAGVMLWQNSLPNRRLLKKIWNSKQYIDHPWWEQMALIKLVEADFQGIQERIEYVPQKILNAYDHQFYETSNPEGEVDASSFIIHYPGLSNEIRKPEMMRRLHEAWKPSGYQLTLSRLRERIRKTPSITSPCPSSPK